jgi:hypothetical protein
LTGLAAADPSAGQHAIAANKTSIVALISGCMAGAWAMLRSPNAPEL